MGHHDDGSWIRQSLMGTGLMDKVWWGVISEYLPTKYCSVPKGKMMTLWRNLRDTNFSRWLRLALPAVKQNEKSTASFLRNSCLDAWPLWIVKRKIRKITCRMKGLCSLKQSRAFDRERLRHCCSRLKEAEKTWQLKATHVPGLALDQKAKDIIGTVDEIWMGSEYRMLALNQCKFHYLECYTVVMWESILWG